MAPDNYSAGFHWEEVVSNEKKKKSKKQKKTKENKKN